MPNEKQLTTKDDYDNVRAAANTCRVRAHDLIATAFEQTEEVSQIDMLLRSADLFRAGQTFAGRANMMEMFDPDYTR